MGRQVCELLFAPVENPEIQGPGLALNICCSILLFCVFLFLFFWHILSLCLWLEFFYFLFFFLICKQASSISSSQNPAASFSPV